MIHQPNKHFNTYKEGLNLEFLRKYCMEYGEVRTFLRGDTLEEMGKPPQLMAFWMTYFPALVEVKVI